MQIVTVEKFPTVNLPVREVSLNDNSNSLDELSVIDSFLGNVPVADRSVLTIAIPRVRNKHHQAKGKFIQC